MFTESKKSVSFPASSDKKKTFVIEKTYYPSEIMYGLGLREDQKKNFQVMKKVAAITKMDPTSKMKAILDCSKSMLKLCNGGFQIKMIGDGSQTLESKQLSNPNYTTRTETKNAKDGIIYFKSEIYSKANVSRWALIYESEDDYMNEFYNHLEESMKNLGINIEEPYLYQMNRNSTLKDFQEAVNEVKEEGCQFILFIINKFTGETIYPKLKKYTDLDAQILTQFTKINDKIFTKRGFFDKLNFQICSKLGYPLWTVQKPPALSEKEPLTMILGADVYHSKGKESVCAVVGTVNSDYSKFVSLSSVQMKRGQEIMNEVKDMVLECVKTFETQNKMLPKRILYYRDGVGDTMIDLVKNHELTSIKQSLEEKYGKNAPKITFVIVTKRISDKILDKSAAFASNPRSGTILSAPEITKNNQEFFMIAQNVTEGTVTPTRYQIVVNECGYSTSDLHEITYFQAFNYYGWSGSVKVPAVCQYAHKLAYHVGENYRQSNKFMKLNLYYL